MILNGDQDGARRAIAQGDKRSSADLATAYRLPVATIRRLRREAAGKAQGSVFE